MAKLLALACLAASLPLVHAAEGTNWVAPGTKRMAELLDSIIRRSSPLKNTYRSAERVEPARKFLAAAATPDKKIPAQSQLAIELLQAGQSLEAVDEFMKFEKLAKENGIDWNAENRTTYRSFLSL